MVQHHVLPRCKQGCNVQGHSGPQRPPTCPKRQQHSQGFSSVHLQGGMQFLDQSLHCGHEVTTYDPHAAHNNRPRGCLAYLPVRRYEVTRFRC